MLLEVVLDLLVTFPRDAELRAVLEDEVAAEPVAEVEAGRVPEEGHDPGDRDQEEDVDHALPRNRATDQEGGLPWHEQPDEGSRLEEGERSDDHIGPGPEEVREVVKQLLQVKLREVGLVQVVA